MLERAALFQISEETQGWQVNSAANLPTPDELSAQTVRSRDPSNPPPLQLRFRWRLVCEISEQDASLRVLCSMDIELISTTKGDAGV
jgi:hypothetical protein